MPAEHRSSLVSARRYGRRLYESVWLLPFVLFVVLLLLTAFKISGSSVGVYYPVLYGQGQKDPNLLAGHPQAVRSDEWLVNTQLTIAQAADGFPRTNNNVEGGHDMSVVGDAPYKDWSAAFKPQNLAFFVLPLAFAFAFKWWLLLYLVIVSCYFLALRFFPGRRLLAALLAGTIGLSPFLFWWYVISTLASVFYGAFIILLGIRIINGEKIRWLAKRPESHSQILYIGALTYLLTAFALVLYPPFQIPIALCVAAFLAGYFLDRYGLGKQLVSRAALKRLAIFAASFILAGAVILCFIHTRREAIHAVTHTVYPGSREIDGGGTAVFKLFSTHLQPHLQNPELASRYFNNQSEDSNFLLLLPFLLIPGFGLLYLEYKQTKKLRWSLLAVQLLGVLFLANLFLGGFQLLYKLTMLDKVPHPRLFIGLGFLGFLQLLLVMKSLASVKIAERRLLQLAAGWSFLCLLALVWAGRYVDSHYPLFAGPLLIYGMAAFMAFIIFCFLTKRFTLAAALLAALSLYSVYNINPLYRGLAPLYPAKLNQSIDAVSRPGSTWVTLDHPYFENAAMLADRNSLSGIQPYPNVNLWRQVEGKRSDHIYNRYAHILFTSDPASPGPLQLAQADDFHVKFACTPFIEQHVQYALATHPVSNQCVRLVDTVKYPAATFYLYRIEP